MSKHLSIRSVLLAGIIASFCHAVCPAVCQAASLRGEIGAGIAGAKTTGPAFILRGIAATEKHDFAFGYLNQYGMKPSGLMSEGAALPTVLFEASRVFVRGLGDTELSLGGGIGYTMPNLEDGASETADNDVSFTAVAAFAKRLSARYALSFSVRGFFFNTDSHLTTFGSHIETLSTGQDVEVLDTYHANNSLNFNSVLFMASLRWE